jgi:hypothetical protein
MIPTPSYEKRKGMKVALVNMEEPIRPSADL